MVGCAGSHFDGSNASHLVGRDGRRSILNPNVTEWVGQYNPPVVDLQRQLIAVLSLPKGNVVEFDGDPIKFWTFMVSFDSCVHNTMVSDGAK